MPRRLILRLGAPRRFVWRFRRGFYALMGDKADISSQPLISEFMSEKHLMLPISDILGIEY